MAAVSSNIVQVARVIREHHVLKQIWTPVIVEELHLEQEIGNPYYHCSNKERLRNRRACSQGTVKMFLEVFRK